MHICIVTCLLYCNPASPKRLGSRTSSPTSEVRRRNASASRFWPTSRITGRCGHGWTAVSSDSGGRTRHRGVGDRCPPTVLVAWFESLRDSRRPASHSSEPWKRLLVRCHRPGVTGVVETANFSEAVDEYLACGRVLLFKNLGTMHYAFNNFLLNPAPHSGVKHCTNTDSVLMFQLHVFSC